MGVINEIYTSKLDAVQQKLSSAAGRAGIAAPIFYRVFQDATNQTYSNTTASPALSAGQYTIQKAVSTRSGDYDEIVKAASAAYDVEENMIKAVIQAESSFREDAVSSSGAEGLMQLKPGTAAGLGVADSFSPAQNIMGGTEYLKKQLDRFGDIRLALAAYNAGPGKVESLGITDPDNAAEYAKLDEDVRAYIANVMAYYNTFRAKELQGDGQA